MKINKELIKQLNLYWTDTLRRERYMVSAHDVSKYIFIQKGPMTAMKLQKLLYYCQAWSLVWDESPLFSEEIQAWANGPIVPEIYSSNKGQFQLTDWPQGDPNKLSTPSKQTIDAVLEYYGEKNAQWLSDLTHEEDPWKNARKGLLPGERGDKVITHAAMAEYYFSLSKSGGYST